MYVDIVISNAFNLNIYIFFLFRFFINRGRKCKDVREWQTPYHAVQCPMPHKTNPQTEREDSRGHNGNDRTAQAKYEPLSLFLKLDSCRTRHLSSTVEYWVTKFVPQTYREESNSSVVLQGPAARRGIKKERRRRRKKVY